MQFFYILNIVMLTRLFFFFRDKKLTVFKLFYLIILQTILLFILKIETVLFLVGLILIIINVVLYILEKKNINLNLLRFLSLLLIVIASGFFTSANISVSFNNNFLSSVNSFIQNYFFRVSIENIDWFKINVVTAGFLFLLNEVNFIIRYFFEALSLIPGKEEEGISKLDEKEYNAGRVIGMLERILILFFVLVNQFAAIGFIIAAKGFTRFKELDKREFAEYVLIGTLLSSLFAILTTFLIKVIIGT